MEEKKKNLNWLYVLILVIISIFSVRVEFQNDTFFSIAVGRQITQTGIDMVEHLTWHTDLMYTYSHWLLDLYNYFVYTLVGFKGVYISAIICVICITTSMYYILKKQLKMSSFFTFAAVVFAVYLSNAYLAARAQLLSYLLFLWEIYFIEKLLETNRIKYKIGLIAIPIVIANFHAALFPMYFVLYLPYLLEIIVNKIAKKVSNNNPDIIEKNKENKIFFREFKYSKSLIVIFVISLFTGLLTPIGSTPYTYMFKTMNDGYSATYINELQPTPAIRSTIVMLYSLFFFFTMIYRKSKISVSDLALFGGLLVLGLINIRGIAYLGLIAVIPLFRIIKNCFKDLNLDNIKEMKYIYLVLIFVVISIGVCFLTLNINYSKFVNEKSYPVAASEYILENVDYKNMRIFNSFNFGSYLELKGIPSFMDSRSEMYTKAYNDTEIFKDYIEVYRGSVAYDKIVDKYNLTHLLVNKDSIIDNYMKNDDGYKELYSDNYFVLYEVVRVEAL